MRSDNELLEQLYDCYERKMYQTAYAILKQEWQAEDVVQDAFVKLMKHIRKIKDINSEKTKRFVLRTVKTTAIDYYRKNQKDAVRLCVQETMDNQKVMSVDDMVKAEDRQIIQKILRELPEDYLEIIKLRCYFEVSNKEAAQILEISEDAAAKRFERAKKYVQGKTGGAENGQKRYEGKTIFKSIG